MSEELDQHYIYLIAHKDADKFVGPVKVGFTKFPAKRLSSLQTGNPRSIVILAQFAAPSRALARQAEGVFHEIAHERRIAGEWFDLQPVVALATLVKTMTAIIADQVPNNEDALVMMEFCGIPEAIKTGVRLMENGNE